MAAAAVALADADGLSLAVGARVASAAAVVLAAALALGWSPLVPIAMTLVGVAYATHLGLDEPSLDLRAPVLAALLVLAAELAYWSLEERDGVRGEPGDAFRLLAVVAAFAVGALLLASCVLALVDVFRVRGLAVDLVGAAGAAGVLVAIVLAGRRGTASR